MRKYMVVLPWKNIGRINEVAVKRGSTVDNKIKFIKNPGCIVFKLIKFTIPAKLCLL